MTLEDLAADDTAAHERCAELLVAEFRELAPDAWPTLEQARETVAECLALGPVRVAREHDVVGWIGAHHTYARV